jgi:hypothetical protein
MRKKSSKMFCGYEKVRTFASANEETTSAAIEKEFFERLT